MTLIETLREPKIAKMALFDWVCTLLLAVLISKFTGIDLKIIIPCTIVSAIAAHKLTHTNTQFNYYIGLNDQVR